MDTTPVLLGFRSHLSPAVVAGEGAYLVSRRGITVLRGTAAEVLVPLLDGTRSPEAVQRDAAPRLTADEAADALARLRSAGLLREAPVVVRPDRAGEAYWDLAGLDGAATLEGLALASVRVTALPGIDPAPVRSACLAAGIRIADVEPQLTLVLCDDYLAPELAEVDARHRASGTPWLPARLYAAASWVGPFFTPGDGPCWHCMAARLRHHRRSEQPLQQALGLAGPVPRPPAAVVPSHALAVHAAVLEAVKWLAGLRFEEQGAIRVLDSYTLGARTHPVPRLPQCPVCGDPEATAVRVRAPFTVRSRPKASMAGGGHRAGTPEEVVERWGHLTDPVTGVADEIRRAPGAPDFTHAYLSGHNLAVGASSRAGLRMNSGGKGVTAAEARAGALCEAVERYSGTRHGDEPTVRDTLRALGGDALHPNDGQLFHDRQFRDRDRWNATGSPFQYVPERFDPDRPVDWTPVWSLTDGRQRLLPSSMLYFAPGEPAPGEPRADSSGNAAGCSPEDALIQGFLELVERDAVALWWYNRTRQPAVDLEAFGEPYIERITEGHRRLGREVWALDLTSDLGVPAVVALSRRTGGRSEDIVFGFGAHFDPRIALRRALTELGQMLPAVAGARPDGTGYRVHAAEPLAWWRGATLANQPYLGPDRAEPARTPASWAYTPRTDLRDDVTAAVDLVAAHGMELLVLDQTRPDIGLPVVKVLVPGLRHFWARYAPGRLYDVPVALGRLARTTS